MKTKKIDVSLVLLLAFLLYTCVMLVLNVMHIISHDVLICMVYGWIALFVVLIGYCIFFYDAKVVVSKRRKVQVYYLKDEDE